jgi:hypothetical protein
MDIQWYRGRCRCGASPGVSPSRNSGVPCLWGSTAPIIHHALHAFSLGRHASTRKARPRTKKTGQCYAMPCYLGASTSKHSIDSHDAFARSWTALHHDHGCDHDHHYDHHSHGDNAERHRPRGYLQHPVCPFHNAIKACWAPEVNGGRRISGQMTPRPTNYQLPIPAAKCSRPIHQPCSTRPTNTFRLPHHTLEPSRTRTTAIVAFAA